MLYASTNGSAFQLYSGPITAAPGDSMSAFAVPTNQETHYASLPRTEAYTAGGTFLAPPLFSASSDGCCDTDYPKTITLTDPNENTPTEIVYTLNGGTETLYEAPLAIPGNSDLTAYCRSSQNDQDVYDSPLETHHYESKAEVQLAAPTISPDGGEHEDLVIVTLSPGVDAPEGSRIFYMTDGTDPGIDENGEPIHGTLYSEALVLSVADLPSTPGD